MRCNVFALQQEKLTFFFLMLAFGKRNESRGGVPLNHKIFKVTRCFPVPIYGEILNYMSFLIQLIRKMM